VRKRESRAAKNSDLKQRVSRASPQKNGWSLFGHDCYRDLGCCNCGGRLTQYLKLGRTLALAVGGGGGGNQCHKKVGGGKQKKLLRHSLGEPKQYDKKGDTCLKNEVNIGGNW